MKRAVFFAGKPVQKILVSVTLLLSLGLAALFLAFGGVTGYYIRKNAHENLTFVISRLSNDLNGCLSDLSQCSERLAVNAHIQQFLSAPTRYSNTQAVIDEYYATAAQSSFLSGAILFDARGRFYRYGTASVLTNESCVNIWKTASETKGYWNFSVNGEQYLGYVQSIYDFENAGMPEIGRVVVMMSAGAVVRLMEQYSIYNGLSLTLDMEGETVVRFPAGKSCVAGTAYTESARLKNIPFSVSACIPQNSLFPYGRVFLLMAFCTALTFLGIILFYLSRLNRAISIPIDTAIKEASRITGSARGRLSLSDAPWLNPMIHSVNDLLSRVEEYSHRAFETQQRLYEAELNKQKMDLYLLRKQINAHFAYNSLNTIHALAAEHDEMDIQLIAAGLAELMRYSYSPEEYINIFDEMQLVDQYIAIMNIRFRDKFKADYNVDDRLCQYVILRQIIQPLVENALVHGLENRTDGCCLTINGEILEPPGEEPYLKISVLDNGVGMPPQLLEKVRESLSRKVENYAPDGVAMVNIHRRIQLYCGPRYGLRIESAPGRGTAVSFTFPLKRDPGA